MSGPIVHPFEIDIYVGAGRDWVYEHAQRDKLIHPTDYDPFYVWRIGPTQRVLNIDSTQLDADTTFQSIATELGFHNLPWAKRSEQMLTRALSVYFGKNISTTAMAEHCSANSPIYVIFYRERW